MTEEIEGSFGWMVNLVDIDAFFGGGFKVGELSEMAKRCRIVVLPRERRRRRGSDFNGVTLRRER